LFAVISNVWVGVYAWVAEPFSKWGATSARQKNIKHFCDLNWQL